MIHFPYFIRLLLILQITLFCFTLNAQIVKRNTSSTVPHYIPDLEIQLSVIFEGKIKVNGEQINSYSLSWKDTIGTFNDFPDQNRPYELQVVVRDKDTIVGRYTGLSTQMRHCAILTNAEKVEVFFMIRRNLFFQNKPVVTSNSEGNRQGVTIPKVNLGGHFSTSLSNQEYTPIEIQLEKDSQNIVSHYDKKNIILKGNESIVDLYYQNKGALNPDPMPRFGPSYKNVMPLNRYLLHPKIGKIKKGKRWLFFKGVKKCAYVDFKVVDPHLNYLLKNGQKITGKQLIKNKKLDPDFIDFNQFQRLYNSLPY
ncbi:hypothetical protein [Brumimicrobium aurantiacum]|uniref:Uncharacterized protein n=1 Tax=Brumimicrobium aurantiacum TaxID=1737063 RepID=A0A3E1EWG3_9FLAO|nr:hypothetical protein [Brumimicrobium aurantiacum]RFC53895.1 hypothetical protein DXU93_10125 [Brumimicrobium aurantiacum]